MPYKNNIISYQRPSETYQDRLTNKDIKELLKDYSNVDDITKIQIGTHIRYIITDSKTNKKKFRMGGVLSKIDPLGRYVMLSNGTTQPWSVQIPNSIFYKKLTDDEKKDEMKKELQSEVVTNNDLIDDLQKKLKSLINKVSTISNENAILKKNNYKLNKQLNKIKVEIDNNK
jgi:hypothetical protein